MYTGHMPKLRNLLEDASSSSSARLFKFIADPPTVTMQRLKGLMSGSLPTFVDASANFASTEIMEDNLISQFAAQRRAQTKPGIGVGGGDVGPLVFLGDDTWTGLFPWQFDFSVPLPSFDVKDLHTVDDGVLKHLLSVVQGNYSTLPATAASSNGNGEPKPTSFPTRPALVVGHFLGVDHVGHRYSTPAHPVMASKLAQMDAAIEAVSRAIDEDTLLVVMGDHGMTSVGGNHGGASTEEVTAAMLMYSKRPGLFTTSPPSAPSSPPLISQVDIVPTLAMLLGLPIPYASLGAVVDGVSFAPQSRVALIDNGDNDIASLSSLAYAHHVNARQLLSYLHAYNGVAGTFAAHQLRELAALVDGGDEELKDGLERLVASSDALPSSASESFDNSAASSNTKLRGQTADVGAPSRPTRRSTAQLYQQLVLGNTHPAGTGDAADAEALAVLSSAVSRYRRMLLSSAALCRDLWTRFNEVSMVAGIATMAAAVLLGVWALFAPHPSQEGQFTALGICGCCHVLKCAVVPFVAMFAFKPQALAVGCLRVAEACFDILSSFIGGLSSQFTVRAPALAFALATESSHLAIAAAFIQRLSDKTRALLPASFISESLPLLEELPVETWIAIALVAAYVSWPAASQCFVTMTTPVTTTVDAADVAEARGVSSAVLTAPPPAGLRKRGQPALVAVSADAAPSTVASPAASTTVSHPRSYLAGGLAIFLLLLRCDALFTNSFIVAEHTVIVHLLSGLVIALWYDTCRRVMLSVSPERRRPLVGLATLFSLVCLLCIRLTVQRDGWLWPFPPPADVVSSTATEAPETASLNASAPAPVPKVETGTGKSSIGWVLEAGLLGSADAAEQGGLDTATPLPVWRTVWLQAAAPLLLAAFYVLTVTRAQAFRLGNKLATRNAPSSLVVFAAAASTIMQLCVSVYWHSQQVPATLLKDIVSDAATAPDSITAAFRWAIKAAVALFSDFPMGAAPHGTGSRPLNSHSSMVDASSEIRLSLPRAVYVFSLVAAVLIANASVAAARRGGSRSSFAYSTAAFIVLLPSFSLLLGPGSTVVLLAAGLQALSLAGLRLLSAAAVLNTVDTEPQPDALSFGGRFVACVRNLLSTPLAMHSFALSWSCLHYYLATGHGNQFNSLHFSAPFVGFDTAGSNADAPSSDGSAAGSSLLVSGLMMVANTTAAHICFFGLFGWDFVTLGMPSSFSSAADGLLALVLPNSIALLCTSIFCCIARRHLMVWAIFAPKFVFDTLHLLAPLAIGAVVAACCAPLAGAASRRSHTKLL